VNENVINKHKFEDLMGNRLGWTAVIQQISNSTFNNSDLVLYFWLLGAILEKGDGFLNLQVLLLAKRNIRGNLERLRI
jgi:hypothetical protein